MDKILAENPKQVEQYRGGKTKLQGFFGGQVWFFHLFKIIKMWHSLYGYIWTDKFCTLMSAAFIFSFLQLMKASGGKINPTLMNKILVDKLNAK